MCLCINCIGNVKITKTTVQDERDKDAMYTAPNVVKKKINKMTIMRIFRDHSAKNVKHLVKKMHLHSTNIIGEVVIKKCKLKAYEPK